MKQHHHSVGKTILLRGKRLRCAWRGFSQILSGGSYYTGCPNSWISNTMWRWEYGLPLVIIYVAADIGGIAGGWLSSSLIKEAAMPIVPGKRLCCCVRCACCPWYGLHGPRFVDQCLPHQPGLCGPPGMGFHIYTIASDVFPAGSVATAVGISNLCGRHREHTCRDGYWLGP